MFSINVTDSCQLLFCYLEIISASTIAFSMDKYADFSFCKELPKVELHAHLNGSISDETLTRLLKQHPESNTTLASIIIGKGEKRTMAEGFEMFRILHQIVIDTEILAEVTKDVISDFALDGVKYLELRSTPRELLSTGLTKRSYIETILNVIKSYEDDNKHSNNMIVRFLPSIDRSKSVSDAHETVRLAEEYLHSSNGLVVGIDFSGNPYSNEGSDYVIPLLRAKKSGLKLAVHLAEVEGKKSETSKLLELPPDRIGHGTYILEDNNLKNTVLEQRIPLEVCVTSNVKTGTVPEDHTKHHVAWWRREHNHPCVICTDDKGIFATNLSNEYFITANALRLSRKETFDWSKDAIDHVFADWNTKHDLCQTWDQHWKTLSSEA